MALFFTLTLLISIVGMITLLAAKRYELNTGKLILAGVRPHISSFFEQAQRFGHTILPDLVRKSVERAVRYMLLKMHEVLARAVANLQRLLDKLIHAAQNRTGPVGEPSSFLRQVSDHKKNISFIEEQE
jgi:hypothetical protein